MKGWQTASESLAVLKEGRIVEDGTDDEAETEEKENEAEGGDAEEESDENDAETSQEVDEVTFGRTEVKEGEVEVEAKLGTGCCCWICS